MARTWGVSRVHINKLLADSPAVEAGKDRVVFHPAFSLDYERYFVTNVLLTSTAAREVVGGWRYPPAVTD